VLITLVVAKAQHAQDYVGHYMWGSGK